MFSGDCIIDIDLMRAHADLMDEALSSSDYNQEMAAKLLGMIAATADFYNCLAANSYREQAIITISNESDIEKIKHSLVATLKLNADVWEQADKVAADKIRNIFKTH